MKEIMEGMTGPRRCGIVLALFFATALTIPLTHAQSDDDFVDSYGEGDYYEQGSYDADYYGQSSYGDDQYDDGDYYAEGGYGSDEAYDDGDYYAEGAYTANGDTVIYPSDYVSYVNPNDVSNGVYYGSDEDAAAHIKTLPNTLFPVCMISGGGDGTDLGYSGDCSPGSEVSRCLQGCAMGPNGAKQAYIGWVGSDGNIQLYTVENLQLVNPTMSFEGVTYKDTTIATSIYDTPQDAHAVAESSPKGSTTVSKDGTVAVNTGAGTGQTYTTSSTGASNGSSVSTFPAGTTFAPSGSNTVATLPSGATATLPNVTMRSVVTDGNWSSVLAAINGSSGGTGFVPLAPIPGLNQGISATQQGVATFLNNLYFFAIGIAVILAIGVIIYGGIEYALSEAVTSKSAGRKRITQALFGLVLVLAPALVFSIINPQILKLNVAFEALQTSWGTYGATTNPIGGTAAATPSSNGSYTDSVQTLQQQCKDAGGTPRITGPSTSPTVTCDPQPTQPSGTTITTTACQQQNSGQGLLLPTSKTCATATASEKGNKANCRDLSDATGICVW